MPLSRSAQLQHLADLALEELELLEAPAARLSGGSRTLGADRVRQLRRQAALWRATAAALDEHANPLDLPDEGDKPMPRRAGEAAHSGRHH